MGIPSALCIACTIVVPVAVLAGALVALPVAFPPLRSAAQSHSGLRRGLVILVGLAGFALGYAGWASVYSSMNYTMSVDVYIEADCRQERCLRRLQEIDRNRAAIGTELWQRMMVPPPLRSACYSADANICALADETYWGAYPAHVTPGRVWGEYLSVLLFSLLPAATAVAVAMRLTIPRKAEALRSFAALQETAVHPNAGQDPTSPATAAASRSPALRRSSR